MNNKIGDALNSALYHEKKLNIIANNLANINTIGFKKDILFQTNKKQEESNDYYINKTSSNEKNISSNEFFTDFSQGQLIQTNNKFDFSLEGDGYFCIQTPEGIQYTRKGNFMINEKNELCTQEGYNVLGENGIINLTNINFDVDINGKINVNNEEINKIKIQTFSKQSLIKNINGYFLPNNKYENEKISENTLIHQGYIERSNVDAVEMMVQMIDSLRGFESYQKIIQILNENNQKAINDIGQVS